MLLKSFSGAKVTRVIDRANARVPEHSHDWPVACLFVIGAYTNHTELGEIAIAGPSTILYRAGAAHRNDVSSAGFEQIEIEFDPAWLGCSHRGAPVRRWLGGSIGASAKSLARQCDQGLTEETLRTGLRRLMEGGAADTFRPPPRWVSLVDRRLRANTATSVAALAEEIGRHPSWLGAAYKLSQGEGILETAARFRVERAARLLRETDLTLAKIASEAGFCDQSHMNRILRRVLGRTPSAVRRERQSLRQASEGALGH